MYIHTYTYTYRYIYIHTHTHMFISTYTYTYTSKHIYTQRDVGDLAGPKALALAAQGHLHQAGFQLLLSIVRRVGPRQRACVHRVLRALLLCI